MCFDVLYPGMTIRNGEDEERTKRRTKKNNTESTYNLRQEMRRDEKRGRDRKNLEEYEGKKQPMTNAFRLKIT